jgi:hypothetical protein
LARKGGVEASVYATQFLLRRNQAGQGSAAASADHPREALKFRKSTLLACIITTRSLPVVVVSMLNSADSKYYFNIKSTYRVVCTPEF